jgi:uncharacterized SAM-binding protein YcdF (DUF218 family)
LGYILSKALPLIILPLGLVVTCLVLAVTLRRWWLVRLALVTLLAPSLPITADLLNTVAEGDLERIPASSMPIADAVVVLSSGRSVAPGIEGISEWGDADRFFGGLALLDAGRAPYLVFTGGANPLAAEAPLEGDVLSAFAQRIGISPDAIRTTGPVTNTLEEAQAVAALMRGSPGVGAPPHVLLVTSAFHMPRASAVFERQGLRVTVFPVDFDRPASLRTDVLRFLPDAGALATSHRVLRELLGRVYYRVPAVRGVP